MSILIPQTADRIVFQQQNVINLASVRSITLLADVSVSEIDILQGSFLTTSGNFGASFRGSANDGIRSRYRTTGDDAEVEAVTNAAANDSNKIIITVDLDTGEKNYYGNGALVDTVDVTGASFENNSFRLLLSALTGDGRNIIWHDIAIYLDDALTAQDVADYQNGSLATELSAQPDHHYDFEGVVGEQVTTITDRVGNNDIVYLSGTSTGNDVARFFDAFPTVAVNETFNIDEDFTATGNVLDNDTDGDETLTVESFEWDGISYAADITATIAGVGSLTINIDGGYLFTPAQDYNGAFPLATYTTNTGATASLTGTINPVEDPPPPTAGYTQLLVADADQLSSSEFFSQQNVAFADESVIQILGDEQSVLSQVVLTPDLKFLDFNGGAAPQSVLFWQPGDAQWSVIDYSNSEFLVLSLANPARDQAVALGLPMDYELPLGQFSGQYDSLEFDVVGDTFPASEIVYSSDSNSIFWASPVLGDHGIFVNAIKNGSVVASDSFWITVKPASSVLSFVMQNDVGLAYQDYQFQVSVDSSYRGDQLYNSVVTTDQRGVIALDVAVPSGSAVYISTRNVATDELKIWRAFTS